MPNSSNNANNSVLADIEAIIARATAEAQAIYGVEPNTPTPNSVPEHIALDNVTPAEESIIPERTQAVVVDEATSRFSGAIWYDKIQQQSVILAGVGGIGSFVGLLLGRLKIQFLTLYDPDSVEVANMSGQLYGRRDIGRKKVYALGDTLIDYSDFGTVAGIDEPYSESSESGKIMICGFDNMEARRVFYGKWKSYVNHLPVEERKECLFIDGRLAAEEYQVLCIKGDDIYSMDRYQRDFLFSDNEAMETICSYKQTTFMANMIASTMVNLFVNFVANQCDPLIPRDLPFFTEYSAETMYLKVIE